MSFYGKIYNQIGNIFNKFIFVVHPQNRADKYRNPLPTEKTEIILTSQTNGDSLSLENGNRWISFGPGDKENSCYIYHSIPTPLADKFDNQEDFLISEIRNDLTKAEKDEFIEGEKKDYYIDLGGKITLKTPVFDRTGHICKYNIQEYLFAEAPNLQELRDAVKDVNELKTIVGLPFDGELPEENLLIVTNRLNSTVGSFDGRIIEIEEVLGFPLTEGDELPQKGLVNLTISLNNTVGGFNDRISSLEKIIGTPTQDDEILLKDGLIFLTSSLSQQIQQIQEDLGPLSAVQPEGSVRSVTDLIGNLSELGTKLKPEEMTLVRMIGNIDSISKERESLAEILGDLDSSCGENQNISEILRSLQDDIKLIKKALDL